MLKDVKTINTVMILITNAGITTILILSLFLGKDAVMKLFA
jgi:hypothetical protein